MKITFDEVEISLAKKLGRYFTNSTGFVEANPGRMILPRVFNDMQIGPSVLNLPVRADDIWLVSYARSGSTWCQEMVWLLGNKLDYDAARSQIQLARFPILESTGLLTDDFPELMEKFGNTVDYVRNMPSQRFIKSHMPWNMLPTALDTVKPKIVYIARNPKDLCVSYYHYSKLLHSMNATFEEYCELFLNHQLPLGNIWTHVLPFWERRNEPNILFFKYEDLRRDLPNAIKKCVQFLEVPELSQDQMNALCEHLQFEKMQKNASVNYDAIIEASKKGNDEKKDDVKFIRKGQIGDWRNFMNDEMAARFDDWIEKNSSGSGLKFDYE